MGQYFQLVSPDREEYVNLPGLMKAGERITNPAAMGILGYLILEGPNDGTTLTQNANTDTEQVREKVEELKERERENEEKYYKKYLNERPSYIVNQFTRKTDVEEPSQDIDAFDAFCQKQARSTYRNDDGSWNQDDLIRIALSHLEIKDTHDFAGRWGGCRVALTGDYSNEEWYGKTKKQTLVELPDGERIRLQGVRELCDENGDDAFDHPISVSDIPRADSPGDYVLVKETYCDEVDEDTVGEVVRVEEPEYTNITDGLLEEFAQFVPKGWLEDNGSGRLEPDMVISQ